jgi:triacylglycerol lipase
LEEIMPKPLPADTWNNLFYPPSDYRYFENSDRFDFEPGTQDFSWRNAWWLADAALLSYVKNWDDVRAILTGTRFDHVKSIGADAAKSTKGFFASRSGPSPFAVVAFRGTDRDDPRNAATDADTLTESRDGYIVHRGFSLALDQVWNDEVKPVLADFITSHPGAPVYFTGHSLGAALATIAVTRFAGGAWALYTVGSPRVGDDRFVRAVLQKTRQVVRFVNSQDIVTLIPPEFALEHYYRHVGLEKYIDRTGVIHDHPSEFDKGIDVGKGIVAHDGIAALTAIGHPDQFLSRALQSGPLVDPPPYIIGNHTPARYAIRIWNFYSGL